MNTFNTPLILPSQTNFEDGEAITKGSPTQAWRQLGYLNVYRLVLAMVCLAIGLYGGHYLQINEDKTTLFLATSFIYLLIALASQPIIRWQIGQAERMAYTHFLCDIIAITLLMHASGGVHSGLGMLLVVAIAAGSLIMAGEMSRFFAAIATLAVLTEQTIRSSLGIVDDASYTHAGLLGASFFATSILAHNLAKRLRESEALAARRGIDLANMAQLTEYIIQRMQTGIIVVDSENNIRLVNESARQLLAGERLRNKQHLSDFSQELVEQLDQWRKDDIALPESFRVDQAGSEIQPRFARLQRDSNSGTLIFLEDLAAATQQAQQMKLVSLGQLTASIAHEIRNPLAAICHASQLLTESPELKEKDRRLLEIVLDHSQRVNTIVRNIMQLSRRETSRPYRLRLPPWLHTFADRFRHEHGLSNGQFKVIVKPIDIQVQIDPDQLQMILDNLCQNALRHGHTEHIKLQLSACHDSDRQRPYLDIIDNGPGISEAALAHIFEPFFTTSRAGTGLGLYIARELCESNQAQLTHIPLGDGQSGCCFRVTFADPRRKQVP